MSSANAEPRPTARLLVAICFICVIGSLYELRAQSPCPQSGNAAWPQNSTIRFYIDFNLPDIAEEQIRRAMAKWNTANQTNGSGVSFVEEPNPGISTTSLTFEEGENPTTLPDGTPGWAAARTHKDVGPDGNLRTATTTFDPTLKAGIDTTLGSPGLDTIFEKLGLHEVGHTMGLGHVSPGDEEGAATVMNTGQQVNDSWNNQALNITRATRMLLARSLLTRPQHQLRKRRGVVAPSSVAVIRAAAVLTCRRPASLQTAPVWSGVAVWTRRAIARNHQLSWMCGEMASR